jgi:ATP-binding cassette subfamily G (WHITE) protein 2
MFEASRLYGGFFASPKLLEQIPDWKFVDALSYLKYTFLGIAINELEDLTLECVPGQKCTYTKGSQIMAAMGYDRYTKEYCAGLLIVLIIGWRLLAYLGLRFIKV